VVHKTAQNIFDNLHSYPPDNHHYSAIMPVGGNRLTH